MKPSGVCCASSATAQVAAKTVARTRALEEDRTGKLCYEPAEMKSGRPSCPAARSSDSRLRRSARDAVVVVLRTELLAERDRIGERLDALHRPVRHVGNRPALPVHGLDV